MSTSHTITCAVCGTANQAQNTVCSACGQPVLVSPQLASSLETGYRQTPGYSTSTNPTESSADIAQPADLPSLAGYHQTPGYAPSTIPPQPSAEEMAGLPGRPPSKHGVSRRTVLIGLVGLTAAAAIGTTVFTRVQNGFFHPSSTLSIYHGHSDDVTSVAWSPDGKRIVSTSYDETAQVWGPLTGKQFVTFLIPVTSVQAWNRRCKMTW